MVETQIFHQKYQKERDDDWCVGLLPFHLLEQSTLTLVVKLEHLAACLVQGKKVIGVCSKCHWFDDRVGANSAQECSCGEGVGVRKQISRRES